MQLKDPDSRITYTRLAMAVRSFVPVRIVHGLAMKFCAVFRRVLAASREIAVIPLPVVQVVIHMSVKMIASVEPGSCTDEDTAVVPLRPVISVGRALVRRSFIVAVGASRRRPDFDRNLCPQLRRRRKEQAGRNRHS